MRESALLAEPLVVRGTLEYRGPGELARRVVAPYTESVVVSGDRVELQREGERPRRFSLRRAPELAGVLGSFSALLGGDAAALQQTFDARVDEGEDGRWTLRLEPVDHDIAERIPRVTVHGAGDAPRCFVVDEAEGERSTMLVGDAAAVVLPEPLATDWLQARCRGDGAA